jgi:riboflavin synthase
MFSGIIEELAVLEEFSESQLVVSSRLDHAKTAAGDSIALNGCCLTVVQKKLTDKKSTQLSFDVSPETKRRTTIGSLAAGDKINLERSLVVGERLHGHFVMGHVDTVVSLKEKKTEGNSLKLIWALPADYAKFIAEKGSVSLSGVSLTVGEVGKDFFNVYIIPHTAEVTTLGAMKAGDLSNLEIDIFARYVLKAER